MSTKSLPFAGDTLSAILEKHPTPIHLYDEGEIRRNARALSEAFSWNQGFKEYFAVKAAPNPYLLKVLSKEGFGADCSSLPELLVAERVGVVGKDIMFTSNDTPPEEFQKAKELGAIINLSVLRELGPVLAAIMLAGRVGGALAAELGTMRVTEQIDALRAMGSDPMRVLVMPRFVACLLLAPILVLYADLMGVVGGYLIAVHVYHVNAAEFWDNAGRLVEMFDITSGLIKSVFFGATIALICCFRGFNCRPGAAGVGRACTQGFVESCMTVLAIDFFLGVLLNTIYLLSWGNPPLL